MDLKQEFTLLVKTAKENVKKAGKKLTNEDIGEKLSIGGTYVSGMIGGSKKVTKKHIEDFKSHFKSELEGLVLYKGDPMNPERALLLAIAEDYAEWKAACTNQSFEEVKAGLKKRGNRILGGLESWLPGES